MPKVLDGISKLFEELFNVKFQKIEREFPKWHEDVEMYCVKDTKYEKILGHFYFDPYYREEKAYAGADKGW